RPLAILLPACGTARGKPVTPDSGGIVVELSSRSPSGERCRCGVDGVWAGRYIRLASSPVRRISHVYRAVHAAIGGSAGVAFTQRLAATPSRARTHSLLGTRGVPRRVHQGGGRRWRRGGHQRLVDARPSSRARERGGGPEAGAAQPGGRRL